ncbi:NAD-dependent epimerase/dehydratase family protein [Streptomyces telluris]|uniref:NAD-dependent epimerase/dehydratase family protein n=1 Tax=Streptomyces telluris TaxID=2720021 RepID=A0A9X2LFP1_9ACTN|nr:NAD-dependent epimerase/dehydratase family protein [Streptomyces telluris]MCQ8770466.1 NAD-dependent epimerase/dehydratase family protein [Streptomyces telluris]NJP78979.1 NAD-dependent epimerase/dehydratase family protein [Streptomyces telluris]
MKVLVTGGGGFLGGAVCAQLVARGDTVRSLGRSPRRALARLGVEEHLGDLRDADAVAKAVDGRDAVIHCAAKAGVWGPARDYIGVNLTGTAHVVAACRAKGVGALVLSSSPAVVHDGADLEGADESLPYATRFLAPYPRSKALAEQLVLRADSADLATVALRPHIIWGPGDPHFLPRLAEQARRGRLRRIGKATKKIDTVYIDNAAEAHVLALDRLKPGAPAAGRAYFITQDDPRPVGETIDRLLGAAGVGPVTRELPAWACRALAAGLESGGRALGTGEPPLTRFLVNQLTTAHWFDITAAKRDLGYVPRVGTEEGLRRLRAAHEVPAGRPEREAW